MSPPSGLGDFFPRVLHSDCPSQIVSNLVKATLLTILSGFFFNFTSVFCQGLKMCMTLAVILRLIFCLFSQFELSHFWLDFRQSI